MMTPPAADLDGGDTAPVAPPVAPPPKRGPGHRGQDIRDTMAEMAAKAHEISLEAGSKMASAMRDVVGAAAGISAFAIESARDLVNYMVRRGQMSQDEATKLLAEVEEAHAKRAKSEPKKEAAAPVKSAPPPKAAPALDLDEDADDDEPAPPPMKKSASAPKPAPAKAAPPAAKSAPAKAAPAAKSAPAPKPAAKKPAAKKKA